MIRLPTIFFKLIPPKKLAYSKKEYANLAILSSCFTQRFYRYFAERQ